MTRPRHRASARQRWRALLGRWRPNPGPASGHGDHRATPGRVLEVAERTARSPR